MKLIHRHGQPGSRQYAYRRGAKDCLPIAAGYFACAFAIGIAAKNAGLNAVEGFFASLLGNASAGEYACFTVIAADAPYVEMVLVTLVANARYILMSCAISQHIAPRTPWYWRLLIGFDLMDELFGVYIAQPGYLDPHYAAGAMSVSLPAWAIGTSLGIIAGTLLPARAVSAMPRLGCLKLFGLTGTGLAQPTPATTIINRPNGSMWRMGFQLRRPRLRAV